MIIEIPETMLDELRKLSEEEIQKPWVSRAPGRIEVLGHHTDYNGGNVFPCALTIGTYALVRQREDKNILVNSLNFKELGILEFSLENMIYEKQHDWANYPKGVIKTFENHGYNFHSNN